MRPFKIWLIKAAAHMYIHIFIFLSICFKIEKSTTIDIALKTKKRAGSKSIYIQVGINLVKFFSRDGTTHHVDPTWEIFVPVFKEWVAPPSGSSGAAAVAPNVPWMRNRWGFFPNGGEEGRGSSPPPKMALNSDWIPVLWEVLYDWFTRIMSSFL